MSLLRTTKAHGIVLKVFVWRYSNVANFQHAETSKYTFKQIVYSSIQFTLRMRIVRALLSNSTKPSDETSTDFFVKTKNESKFRRVVRIKQQELSLSVQSTLCDCARSKNKDI